MDQFILYAMLWLALGYVAGSVPTGVLIARAMGLGDLRQIGSGNIGATNVLRTGNKKAAAGTLAGDALKGAIIVLLARALHGNPVAQYAAFGALLGHCFPIWLDFRGGKGVATFIGALLAMNLPAGLAVCATWALCAWRLRISSLSALTAIGLAPVFVLFSAWPWQSGLVGAMTLIVVVRHRENIIRLARGAEPRIGAGQ